MGPGPGEVGQGGQKVLHLWHHSQKIHTPNQKNFIVQTTRLAKSFELLTGSAALIGPEKIFHPAVFAQTTSTDPGAKLLIILITR